MRRLALMMLLFAMPASAESPPPNAPQQAAAAPDQPAPARDPSPVVRTAQSTVQTKLVTPLAEKESVRSRFSRVVMPTPLLRVRMTAPAPQKDDQGADYVTFAVDSCRGFPRNDKCWQAAAITGCVYPGSGQVFVQRGDRYYPADIMLGKRVDAAGTVCKTSNTPST